MKRLISAMIVLVLLISIVPRSVAIELETPSIKPIQVVVDKCGEARFLDIDVIVKGDDLYMTPKNFSDVTRYTLSENQEKIIFVLGLKSVVIDVVNQELAINQVTRPFSGTIDFEGSIYLPMSELLPWLNVQCYVKDGLLHIDSDIRTYWEAIENFRSEDYLFDLAEAYGETTADQVGLSIIAIFDCILDLENIWKKAVRIGDSETTIYEYNIYKECLRGIALPDNDTAAEIQKSLSNISDSVSAGSQFVNSAFKALYSEETATKFSELFGEDMHSDFENLPMDVSQLTDSAKIAKEALKYIKTCFMYARVSMADTSDYSVALQHIYMRDGVSFPGGITLAASEAIKAYESNAGNISTAAATILSEFGIKLIEDLAGDAVDDMLNEVAGDTILGSLGLYLDIVDATLSMVWPINDAYEELTKMTIYQSIQYDALNAYLEIPKYNTELCTEDICKARTSLLIFLKTAKKCFKAQEETFELFGAEGVLDVKLKKLNNKILDLELAKLSEENDAVCDKQSAQQSLRELWRKAKIITADSNVCIADYFGEWVGESVVGGPWDRFLTIINSDDESILFDLRYGIDANYSKQVAEIQSDGGADFTVVDGQTSFSGTISFGETVTLYISESNHSEIKPGTVVFTRKIHGDEKVVIGEWTLFRGGQNNYTTNYYWTNVDQTSIALYENGTATLLFAHANSDNYFGNYEATWTREIVSHNESTILFDFGDHTTIRGKMIDDKMIIESAAGQGFEEDIDIGDVLELGLDFEVWKSRCERGEITHYATDYFSITLPDDWFGRHNVQYVYSDSIAFGQKASYDIWSERDSGGEANGFLFSLSITETLDYEMLPAHQLVGFLTVENTRYHVYAYYPSGVTFIESEWDEYREMREQIPQILQSIKPRNGAIYEPFISIQNGILFEDNQKNRFVQDLAKKYGISSIECFDSCIGTALQPYPAYIQGIISVTEVHIDKDYVGREFVVLRVSEENSIYCDIYKKESGGWNLVSSEIIYDISFCTEAFIYLFYSSTLNQHCLMVDTVSFGSYTGVDYLEASVYTLSTESIECYGQWISFTNEGLGFEVNADFLSEFEKADVPYAKNCISIEFQTNAIYYPLCNISHSVINESESYLDRIHRLSICPY